MSDDTGRHYLAIAKAYYAFGRAWKEQFYETSGQSVTKWKRVKKRLVELERATSKAHEHVLAHAGGADHSVVALIPIGSRAAQFVCFCRKAIETMDRGDPFTINPGDVPIIFDDE